MNLWLNFQFCGLNGTIFLFFVEKKLEEPKNQEGKEMSIIHLFWAHEFRIYDEN